jgi:uncharacterized protein YlaI
MNGLTDETEFPLFSSAAFQSARTFHERDEAQATVLWRLRDRTHLTKVQYEREAKNGSRLAPIIEQLRNAHGFAIAGDGSVKSPYHLDDVRQCPKLARVTPDMKAAYYGLPHWLNVRRSRLERDGRMCVLCDSVSDLRCHHVTYEHLFAEPLRDLMTVCDSCHDRLHAHCRLKFPSGVSVQYAHWIGWKGFERWLLP